MNKYRHILVFEFKHRMSSMLIWIGVWVAFACIILLFFDNILSEFEQLKPVIENLPQGILVAAGVNIESITKIEGFVNSRIYLLSILVGGIWAGNIGASLIGKDEKNGALAWLVTNPVSRTGIYLAKIIPISLWLMIVNLVIMAIISYAALVLTSIEETPLKFFIETGIGLSVYYLLLMSIGNLGAIVFGEDKGRALAIFAVVFNFTTNIISSFDSAPDIIRYFTTYYYFNPEELLKTGEIDPLFWVLVILTIVVLIIAGVIFNKKDIHEP